MKLIFDLLLAGIAVWTAHLAGAVHILSKTNPSAKRNAAAYTIISIVAALALIIRD